jgi:hypothetical protein
LTSDVRELTLGTVTVDAPVHLLEPPPVTHAQSATFDDLVSLVGYTLLPPDRVSTGDTLSVELVWQVHRQTRTAYKTFVHLLDAEGRRVAGSDQVPGNWQRPTTGWIAEEYITDIHTFTVPAELPAGTYRLQAGLYNAVTGERLLRMNDAETVVLEDSVEVSRAP